MVSAWGKGALAAVSGLTACLLVMFNLSSEYRFKKLSVSAPVRVLRASTRLGSLSHLSKMCQYGQLSALRAPENRLNLRAFCQAAGGVDEGSVSAIILAGGVGKRMGAPIPKQYIKVEGKPIASYSLEMFAKMPEVGELVVVCLEEWQYIFEEAYKNLPDDYKKPLIWARPGGERQDSVYNGFKATRKDASLVAIHDSARPLVNAQDARNCMIDGVKDGAAVLGVPVKPTIKEVNDDGTVCKTLVRSRLWEVQTPQCIKPALLEEGFQAVKENNLEVTDDVSIIEAIGKPVRITKGSYTNIKVTTPDDMAVMERFLADQKSESVAA